MSKTVAFTFDDGPNTVTTPRVLDILEENGIVASFFLIARNITEESAEVARRALRMGCEINNHTVSHPHLNQLPPEEIRAEFDGCTEQIVRITGQKPKFFRPPFIDVNQDVFNNIDLPFISGVGCRDWEPQVTARERIDLVMSQVKDGDLILLHDMAGNENTVEAIRFLIPELKKQGYRFLTCSQIFAENGVTPRRGILYSNVFQTA